MKPVFTEGDSVEVQVDSGICGDAWFPATVLNQTSSKHFLVELQASHNNSFQLLETVDSQHIRPLPPQMAHVDAFQLSEKVDALYYWRWWSGVINKVLSGGRYVVFFKSQNKLKEFVHSDLRIHMDWIDGKWFRDSKEISVAQHNQCGTESCREALSEEAVNTNQIIDLVSPLGLDATKNVAKKTLPIQTQTQQDRNTFQCTDMAHPSSGNAVKTVASKKLHSPRISRKVEYRSNSEKSCSTGKAHNVDAAKKISSEKSPSCLSGKEVEAPISLIACPVRGMSMGSPAVNKNFLAHCSKDQPEPLNSGQDKKKHDLESNGPRNLHSVEGCSSHLPYIIDIEEDTVVESPKLQTLAQQMKLEVQMPRQKRKPLGDDDIEQQEMEGVSKQKMNAFDRRGQTKPLGTKATVKGVEHQAGKSQTHDARIETQTEGPEHTSASKTTTTFVVKAEDKCKEIKMDGASKDNRDSDPHISMCIEESYFPSSIDETGVSSANQPMVQAMESDAPMRGLEFQNPLNVTDNSYRLEGTTVVKQSLNHFPSTGESCSTGKTHNVDAAKKISSEKSPSCLSGKEVEAPISLIACPVRGMSLGSPVVNKNFLAHCSKDQYPEILNSGQDKKQYDLESNGARNLHSVAGCSSHLPYVIDIEEDQVVESPKLQTLARQMKLEGNGSRNQSSVEGSSHLPPNIIDVEQSEVVDLPKTQVPVRPTKLMIRQPLGRKGEPLTRDDINQPTTKKMSKQILNVYNRKTRAEDFSTKASVKDVEHSGTIGRLQAPVLTSSEAQIKGPEQTTPSDSKDLHPPSSVMCLRNSNVAQIIDENGMSYDNQPAALSVNAITRKDSPLGGSQLRNSLNVDVSSFCFEGAATNILLDQAIGDEVSEHTQQTFLICSNSDPMLLEDESFPFIKCSPAWEIVESWEVFRVIPQWLHFRPLEQFDMGLREGLAIGSMVSFANIVEKVRKSKLDDPPSILQARSKALEDLKAYGFNVQPIQGRLETILRIKDEHAKLNGDLMKVEDEFNMKFAEKISREKELDELNRKMRELQECLNQLSKKKRDLMTVLEKEVQDSMADLKKTMDNVRGHIHSVTSEFRTVVATPW